MGLIYYTILYYTLVKVIVTRKMRLIYYTWYYSHTNGNTKDEKNGQQTLTILYYTMLYSRTRKAFATERGIRYIGYGDPQIHRNKNPTTYCNIENNWIGLDWIG